ncbi:MAG: hypothetical protein AAF791_07515 [Bacteroidota bacterium]
MRPLLASLALAFLLSGCDLFGGDALRITYSVNATGANGPVTLTYDGPDGPVRVEDAFIPFSERIQINGPRVGSVYLLNAETTCNGPCTLTVEVEAAVGGTPFTSEDEVVYTESDPRTVATSASILYR